MKDIYEQMAVKWPSAVIARAEIGKFTGGGLSPKYLANLDSAGTGAKGRFKIGRRVCYSVPALVGMGRGLWSDRPSGEPLLAELAALVKEHDSFLSTKGGQN